MNRRSFLITTSALAGGALVLPAMGLTTMPTATSYKPGIQLYTLRNVLNQDLEGTLNALVSMGYEEVETHSHYGRTPDVFREILQDAGLDAPAAHYGAGALRDDLDRIIEEAGILGHQFIFCPHPGPFPFATIDDYRRLADFLTATGSRLKEVGIQFGYHNHDFECRPIDGQIPLFVLFDDSDADAVSIELDLFWAVHGGIEPMDVIRRYPGRVHAFHVKDRTAEGEMVDVGKGVIDFGRLFAAGDLAGLKHAFVEHDNPADPLRSARDSIAGFNSAIAGA
jgi:sugar phosphate isomerase/epimerase